MSIQATTSPVWERLRGLPRPSLTELFDADEARVAELSQRLEFDLGELGPVGMLLDWSKTHLDDDVLDAFEELAGLAGFDAAREALFGGGIVNPTEWRPATHGAMRGSGTEADVEEATSIRRLRLTSNCPIKTIGNAIEPDEDQSQERKTEPKGWHRQHANKKADQRNLIGADTALDKPGS